MSEGLNEALAGAQVVIDLANSPSFEDKAVLEFFETSGRNLLAAVTAAGVRHHGGPERDGRGGVGGGAGCARPSLFGAVREHRLPCPQV